MSAVLAKARRYRTQVPQLEQPEWPEEPLFVPVWVRPTLFGRMSLSLESAKKIAGDKSNYFYIEALAVIANGGEYWIWT